MNRNGTIKLFSLTTLFAAIFAAMLPAINASAAGFQVNEHSAAGLGRAFAGEAAIAEDASVVARNVAAMSFLEGSMFTGAVSYIKPEVEVEGHSALGTSKDKAVAGEAVVPVFYYVTPINDKWSYGVGGFTNFGFNTDYKTSSPQTRVADFSEVMSYNLNGSVSYKIQNNLSVGFGLNAVYVDAQLTNAANGQDIMNVAGDDWGFGWNAGVFWEPVTGTRIGASYRSEVKTTLDGESKSDVITGTPIPGLNPSGASFNSDGSVDLDLPSIAEISIWQQINDRLAVHASYVQIGWSSFEEIVVDLENGIAITDEQNYEDSSRWSVGATYKYSKDWTLRGGYAYDNSPVGNNDRSFRIPDSDRQWFTVGANYKIDKQQSVDMGYAFLKAAKADVEEESGVGGEITSGNAHIVSVQYNYGF
ncbi:outer membrane protein transport protein [Parendozoicomonas sp. Alg238-R29]|uniref:OmpP1/FadL family transporter n=1 Tax=Parendozoicomonas sp. Alg238-R29 TaxID=2993446 RepID=UPI00248D5786|nr:outer membrane protein transport protein [Parendozoicomonas sp. Alg238-R29]